MPEVGRLSPSDDSIDGGRRSSVRLSVASEKRRRSVFAAVPDGLSWSSLFAAARGHAKQGQAAEQHGVGFGLGDRGRSHQHVDVASVGTAIAGVAPYGQRQTAGRNQGAGQRPAVDAGLGEGDAIQCGATEVDDGGAVQANAELGAGHVARLVQWREGEDVGEDPPRVVDEMAAVLQRVRAVGEQGHIRRWQAIDVARVDSGK